jgi:mRNA-degrading endonuclease toxin of MazEF toxin-antitoxin module
MKCNRGDVVLVLFPDSNLRTAKRRPTLVVQADQLNTGLSQTIVAMIKQQYEPRGTSVPCSGFADNSPRASERLEDRFGHPYRQPCNNS